MGKYFCKKYLKKSLSLHSDFSCETDGYQNKHQVWRHIFRKKKSDDSPFSFGRRTEQRGDDETRRFQLIGIVERNRRHFHLFCSSFFFSRLSWQQLNVYRMSIENVSDFLSLVRIIAAQLPSSIFHFLFKKKIIVFIHFFSNSGMMEFFLSISCCPPTFTFPGLLKERRREYKDTNCWWYKKWESAQHTQMETRERTARTLTSIPRSVDPQHHPPYIFFFFFSVYLSFSSPFFFRGGNLFSL